MLLETVLFTSLLHVVTPVSTGWRPISRPPGLPSLSLGPIPELEPQHPSISYQSHIPEPSDNCALYKAILDQETPSQYVQFKAPIPDMKEFTLCFWHKFYNHSRDQPLFAYSSSHERFRDIYSWVSNSDKQSFYMLSVMGQTMYRLNYPVRLHKWYHVCQSWNGRTGEWQLWINSERIGRGFHNLLVGKTIKGGGVALSGQEPVNNAVGGYQDLYKPTGGLLGEVTLLQLYKAALTAGKAYTNHKHHHAHHFHHDDKLEEDDLRIVGLQPNPTVSDLQSPVISEQQPNSVLMGDPFVRNGQLIPQLPVHELSAFRAQQQQQNSITPQFNVLGTSFIPGVRDNGYSIQHMRLYKRDHNKDVASPPSKMIVRRRLIRMKKPKSIPINENDENDGDILDEMDDFDAKTSVKRDADIEDEPSASAEESAMHEEILKINPKDSSVTSKREKRSNEESKKEELEKEIERSDNTKEEEITDNRQAKSKRDIVRGEKVQKKRTALLGDAPFGVIPGTDLSGLFSGDGYILGGGGLKFNDENQQTAEKDMVQMEPAEWEVRSIMAVCSGCSEDPFRKATIISWRETPKKLYSGVLYIPAIPECQRF